MATTGIAHPSPPPELSAALADRYELRAVLGRGGMATVYMGYDRKHDREVAIKVLRPEIASTIGAERFLSEIRIVARLVHPHILSLHDSGEANGFIYYVMPYIDGGSLRDHMVRERRVSADRAIAVAEPIADALSYAHQMGVLHRDIKPENVLFARDHPIVADFGIAKAVSSATSGAQLTRTGISLGTPGYMSPEQAAGFHDVDARTDVYSLAVLVYEMIVGEIPGRWPTEEATRLGRFLDAPSSHRPLLSAAGARVEGALVRALAVRPDQRTATAAELCAELKGRTDVARRRFGRDEVDAIVNRAVELEASHPTKTGAMTMGGVEEIAREAGIDTEYVRAAASQLQPRSTRDGAIEPVKRNIFAGGPTRLVYQRVIDGEVADSDFGLLVDEIRTIMGEVGQVSQLGRTFTCTMSRGTSGTHNVQVAVSVRGGRTRITVQEHLGQLIGGIFGGLCGGLGGGGLGPIFGVLGGNHMMAAAAFIVPAWLIMAYSIARTSFHYAARARDTKLRELADRLADVADELTRSGG
jgi:tRNA A-37 threonylcarbamoyl transferase component Bud32